MDLFAPRRDGPVVHRYPGPSTLGTFLRLFSLDHVRQLNALAARFLARLGGSLPGWAIPCPIGRFDSGPGRSDAFVDIDNTVRASYGYAKQAPGTAIPAPRASIRCSLRSPYRCRRR